MPSREVVRMIHRSSAAKLLWCLLLLMLAGFAWLPRASAEEVIEVWRGEAPGVVAVSVNPTDGSCWVGGSDGVVHLAEDGTELSRTPGIDAWDLSVNSSDGSCWVAVLGIWDADTREYADSAVVHLAADGTELWRGEDFNGPASVSVNPTDGSCWVADSSNDEVVRLAQDGAELWRVGQFMCPSSVSVNRSDDSGWVADTINHMLVHLSQEGHRRGVAGQVFYPSYVVVNSTDGSCWGAGEYSLYGVASGELVHFAEGGTELLRLSSQPLEEISVNPTDGSCWTAESDQVVHRSESGIALWSGEGFDQPSCVSVNPSDGSCWVADTGNGQVAHLVIWFDDVPSSHWAFDAVVSCFIDGIVAGYPDALYHPDVAVTRGQMAVYISRALAGGDANVPAGPAEATFDDVPTDHWAYKYVEYCVANGVVQGFDPVTYAPTVTVSRDAMAVFISRAVAGGDANVPEGPDTATFDDVPTDYWAFKHVEYCVENDVVQGYPDGNYHPGDVVTRDQMAVYIARAFELPM
jgi:hypothetical protein